jgi:hypothetical protein
MSKPRTGQVGKVDRGIRLILSFVLLGFAIFCPFAKSLGPVVVWGAGLVGGALLGSALVGRCPVYAVLGIRT